MRIRPILGGVVLLLVLVFCGQGLGQEAGNHAVRIGHAQKNWVVQVDLPGFETRQDLTKPDGRRYFYATNPHTGVNFSVTIEVTPHHLTGQDCRHDIWGPPRRNTNIPYTDIQLSERGDWALVEAMVPKVEGHNLDQKNILAYLGKDDACVDVHLSKVRFKASDQELFTTILNSLKVVEGVAASPSEANSANWELMREGSRHYLARHYQDAIAPYQKALDLEKQSPQLSSTMFRVLVDNLGMSYGITGDLARARETFEYGLTKDPTYPLFYYNLACAAAEAGDLKAAGNYLKKAFEYRENVIPGETMPDPRKDDSFTPHLKNKEFRELLNSLMSSSTPKP